MGSRSRLYTTRLKSKPLLILLSENLIKGYSVKIHIAILIVNKIFYLSLLLPIFIQAQQKNHPQYKIF